MRKIQRVKQVSPELVGCFYTLFLTMSKIVNEYGVIDREIVLQNNGLTSKINQLLAELKTFAKVFDLNGEEIDQLYGHFADEVTVAGIEEKMRWGLERRKELRKNKND